MEATSSSSGRDPGTLWDLFVQYSKDRAENVQSAFMNAGYTIDNMRTPIRNAIRSLGLAAHGTGGSNSGKQGDYEETAIKFESKLIGWAYDHEKDNANIKSGLRQSEAEHEKSVAARQVKKASTRDAKHQAFHDNRANSGKICSACGEKIPY
jgi:hypothetical protein